MNTKPEDIEALATFLRDHPRIVVLTGAGISLGAGIPTYRDQLGVWRHAEPVKHQDFLAHHSKRQRYWARSHRGWPAVRNANPTPAHLALAELERRGHIDTVITQNVDRLHQRAGSKRVVDLHGRLDRVVCLNCEAVVSRDAVQAQLREKNPPTEAVASARPDGDADLPRELESQFSVPRCIDCGGTVKPDVVFFGDNVPKARVKACMDAVDRSDALLAIGSSLQVFSGFRFCRRMTELGKPLAILNPGTTRADNLAQLKLVGDCQEVLAAIV